MDACKNALLETLQFSFIIATHYNTQQSLNAPPSIKVTDYGIIILYNDVQYVNV